MLNLFGFKKLLMLDPIVRLYFTFTAYKFSTSDK